MTRRLAAVAVLFALALAGVGVAGPPAGASACPAIAGLDLWEWSGGAATDDFDLAGNWIRAGHGTDNAPGERDDPNDRDDQVCIPPGGTVVVADGESVHVPVFDNRGSVTVEDGGKLELQGDPATYTSSSAVMVLKGLLYGRGTLVVRSQGTLTWNHTLPDGPATMSTREIWATDVPLAGAPGRTVVSVGASLVVSGGAGVNLVDRRIIENRGLLRILGSATYVAADWGTTLRNTGTVDFVSNGDYVQGSVRSYAASGRSRFINTGKVRKTGGSGTSVLDAAYTNVEGSAGPGTVTVSRGTLSIRSDAAAARVDPSAAAATFATGGCPANAACTDPSPSAAEPQFSSVRLPVGTAASQVSITEAAAQPGTIGRPVDVSVPSETASASNPMVLRFGLDATVVPAGRTAADIVVQHNGVTVPACTGGSQAQCVDRSASTTSGGDVVLVVRTASNGRWRML